MSTPMQDDWRRAADIATAAAALPGDEIEPYLDEQCSTAELRSEVEALLATRGFNELDETRDKLPNRRARVTVPERIGPYALKRSLGAGGMGEVFLAHQEEPIEREVAIKLLRSAVHGTAAYRFELERRALARTNHPFIAQIFEAGTTEQGLPFLAMELIEGVAMDRFCDHRRMSIEERLRLFCSVCDGIHHAHQKGLLHRDIKPDNVLVTELEGEATPKIIDFGIAKDLDGDKDPRYLTRVSGVVGTPAYISPEAVLYPGGDVDTRSDVYSLGILLYCLLVEKLPFDLDGDSSWLGLIQRAANDDAPAPSAILSRLRPARRKTIAEARGTTEKALLARLRHDLDAIARKATARNRDERYGSAAELAADVRNFLALRPVLARRADPWDRAKKFIRRHRAGAVASTLVVLSLLAGLIARTFEARRADQAAAAALAAQEDTRQVVDFLVGLFEVSDPERSLGASITARELLETGAARVRSELEDQPLARARLLETIGVVYGNLGLHDEAAKLLEESLDARRLHGGELEVADSHFQLGRIRLDQAETDAARLHFERALQIRREALGGDHPQVADALDHLGQVLQSAARYDTANDLLEEALEIRRRHFGPDSEPVVETLNHLALVAHHQGDYSAAEEALTRLLAIRERLHGSDHPETARALNALANALERQGRGAEAEQYFRRSLAIREAVFGPYHPEVGQSLTNLANALIDQDRRDEAKEYMLRALDVLEEVYGDTHPSVAIAVHNLGDYWVDEEQPERAEPYLRRALAAFLEVRGPDHPQTSYPHKRLGDVLAMTGRLDEAEVHYRRAFEIRFATLPAGHLTIGTTARGLADVLRQLGQTDEAARLEATYPDEES